MTRRQGVAAIALLVMAASSGVAAKVTNIKYATWWAAPSVKSAIALFEKTHPDIKVQFSVLGSYTTTMITMASAGVLPDVFDLETWSVFAFGEPGLTEDLRSYIKRDRIDTSDFLPEYIRAFTYDGRLLAMPVSLNAGAMVYNTTLFRQAGVPPPIPAKNSHWDWADLLRASKKITKDTNGDGNPDVYGWGEYPGFFYKFWLCQNGGRFMSLDLTKVMVGEPAAVEAFQFEADFNYVHGASTFGGLELFPSQKVAMFQGNSYQFPGFRKVKSLQFDLAPWFWQKKPYSEMVASGLALARSSKSKEAAWTFIKWMTSSEGQKALSAIPSSMPARLSVARSSVFLREKPPEHGEYTIEMALVATADDFSNILPSRMMDAFWPEFNKIMAGKTTAAEAMKRAVPPMQRALDDWNKRRLSRRK